MNTEGTTKFDAASGELSVERDNYVATVTMNRQSKLNAIDSAQWRRLGSTFSSLSNDESIRCVVLRGAGGRAFSSGADVSEFSSQRFSSSSAQQYGENLSYTWNALRTCRHPILAMIDGLCLGGGLVLACCADLRIASQDSALGVPAKSLGGSLGYEEIRQILDLIGPGHTLSLLLEGGVIAGRRAAEIGLINQCTRRHELQPAVQAVAQAIAEGAPLVARDHKRFVRRLLSRTPLDCNDLVECFKSFDSDDYRVGYQSFLAKTTPTFRGT